MNFGPDGKRLLGAGDFNIELDANSLLSGNNIVELIAEDNTGAVANKTVTLHYQAANVWPLPYSTNWQSLNDIKQINNGSCKINFILFKIVFVFKNSVKFVNLINKFVYDVYL